MGFWNRSTQLKSKLYLYLNKITRYYIPIHGFNFANHHTNFPVLNNLNYIQNNSALGVFHNVRFYAAPFQANKKVQEKRTSGPKLNDQITTPFIRLVTDEGHSVLPLREAMARAKSLRLDLVEVDRHEKPPVCKIMDYNKEKYIEKLNMKEKERAKSKTTVKTGSFKEVRFAAKIKQNDLKMKAETAKRLMESGYRVKCTAIEPTDDVDLNTLLSQFWALIEDVAVIEGDRKVEKKQAFVVVRHIKFGPSKGSSKKAPKDKVTSQIKQFDSEDISDKNVLTGDSSQWNLTNIDDNDDDENAFDEPHEFSEHEHVNSDASKQTDSPRYQMENRYAKRDMNNRGGLRSSQSLYQAKSPQSDTSEPTNFQRRQTRPDPSPGISNSPIKSYGIFSSQRPSNTSSGEQKMTREFNRYKKKE